MYIFSKFWKNFAVVGGVLFNRPAHRAVALSRDGVALEFLQGGGVALGGLLGEEGGRGVLTVQPMGQEHFPGTGVAWEGC